MYGLKSGTTDYQRDCMAVLKRIPCLCRQAGDGTTFYLRRNNSIWLSIYSNQIVYRKAGMALSLETFLEVLEPEEKIDFLFHLDFLTKNFEKWGQEYFQKQLKEVV